MAPTTDLGTIYSENIRYVWDFLLYLGVPRTDLEDVAHEVFMVVHRRLPNLDCARPLRPWLTAVAVRVTSDYQKKAYRRRELPSDDLTVLAPDADAESALVSKKKREVLLQLLEGLNPDWRAVFVLHDLEQYSAPEVSELLALPLNTVYSRLRRARKRLERSATRLLLRGLL